ncbi:Scarecrow-like protein [Drosera capensis]
MGQIARRRLDLGPKRSLAELESYPVGPWDSSTAAVHEIGEAEDGKLSQLRVAHLETFLFRPILGRCVSPGRLRRLRLRLRSIGTAHLTETPRIEEEEAVVVNLAFTLHKVPDESVSMENYRDELLRHVKGLKPLVVILLEQDMNLNTAPFMSRVNEASSYHAALFRSLDATMTRGDSNRAALEETIGRKIANVVACEGREWTASRVDVREAELGDWGTLRDSRRRRLLEAVSGLVGMIGPSSLHRLGIKESGSELVGMASGIRAIVQDDRMLFQSDGFAAGGKKGNTTNQEKTKPRKPLQEIGKNIAENIGSITRDSVISKAQSLVNKTEKVHKGLETNYKPSSRKPLGDLSNIRHADLASSTKPTAKQAPLKSIASKHAPVSMKANLSPDSVREERFLHDHQECIKTQGQLMDFDYFLETVGLVKDFSTPIASSKLSLVHTTSKLGTPMYIQELNDELEMDEAAIIGSPPCSPFLASPVTDFLELSGFKLQETPCVRAQARGKSMMP